MSSPTAGPSAGLAPVTRFLVLIVAAIGFLFDTYELLMFPVIGADAVAELIKVSPDPTKPAGPWAELGLEEKPGLIRGVLPTADPVRVWAGRMLWIAAVCGGIFGLLGGWLIDRLGRRTIMVASILAYSVSPVFAAFSTELWELVLFRSTTFIGVCVELVAAVTWLAELFEEKRSRELAIGWTLAFSSLGGIFVTEVYNLIVAHSDSLPAIPVPEGFRAHAAWRYTLLTGLVPGALILGLLPFVPESRVWSERKRAGTLRRPQFSKLFAPQLRQTTLVTTLLSACGYAAAFGALQLTPLQIAPGLPDLAAQRQDVVAKTKQAEGKLSEAAEREKKAKAENGLPAERERLEGEAKKLRGEAQALQAETKKAQAQVSQAIRERRGNIQRWQELGGLAGRIILAALLVFVPSRILIRLFLIPGVILFPVTYLELLHGDYVIFAIAIFFCGLFTVAQFSFISELLPKLFPVHLRGTGGSFASNVGGRMIGTMAALLNTEVLSNLFSGDSPIQVATAAAVIGGSVYAIALVASFFLPRPRPEGETA